MNLIVIHTNVCLFISTFEKKERLGKYMDLPRIRRNKKEKEKEKYTSQRFVPRPQGHPPKISSGRAAAHLLEVGKSPKSPKGRAKEVKRVERCNCQKTSDDLLEVVSPKQ